MRIAVISDTHLPRGARRLPDACLEELQRADLVLHAGDVSTAAALAEIEALGPRVVAVHGNVDDTDLRAKLPAAHVVEAAGFRIGMVHDAGRPAGRETRLLAQFPSCDAVVYGHSHLPQVDLYEGCWLLNPGSPTERRRAPTRTMIVLSAGARGLEPHLVEFP